MAGQSIPGSTPVGSTRQPFTVVVKITRTGLAATPTVVTGGVSGLDFSLAASSDPNACVQKLYALNDECKVEVSFTPRFAGLRWGAVVLRDASTTQILGSAQISAVGSGALPVFYPGLTSTVAGHEDFLYQSPTLSDGIPAISAPIQLPKGIALDALGNLYIADYLNYRIRKVAANAAGKLDSNSLITTVAGNGTPGFSGDGGPATLASIASPTGLTIDGAGNLYFADTNNDVIRKVDTAGVISTVAGLPSTAGMTGDGGPAIAATLDHPEGVALDLEGNLLIADTRNDRIRIVSLQSATQNIDTFATGPLARPSQMAVQPDGTLLIANTASNQLLALRNGSFSVLAGSGVRGYSGDEGPASAARLDQPVGVTVDPAGNIYIADQGNNRLRFIDVTTQRIYTVAGTGSESFAGDCSADTTAPPSLCGPQTSASFNGPWSIQFSPLGEVYLSDPFHNRIRRFSGSDVLARYATIRNLKISPPQTITVRNLGNAQVTLTTPTCDQTKLDGMPPSCAFAANTVTTLAPSESLPLAVDYAPNVPGPFPFSGTGSLRLNVATTTPVQTPPVIRVEGQVLDVNPTSVKLVSASNPGLIHTPIHFVATVSNNNAGSLSGSVTFSVDNVVACSSVALSGPTAGCDIQFTNIGHHTVQAEYSGDAQDAGSQSDPLDEVIKLALDPASALLASPNPQTVTQQVTLTFNAVAPVGGSLPTGTVEFSDGGSLLASVPLTNGRATFTTTSLVVGSHALTAAYSGDASYTPYQSAFTQVIQKASTATLLGSDSSTVLSGGSVVFTATITPTITSSLSGTVTFFDGQSVIASDVALNNANQATFTTTTLSSGVHTIRAVYSGDVNDEGSSSAPLAQTVTLIETSMQLVTSANPLQAGATLHLTAQITTNSGQTPNGPVSGTITFSDGGAVLGTSPINANASAFLDVSALTVGSHPLLASYGGDPHYAQSSGTVLEVVQRTDTSIMASSQTPTSLAGNPVTLSAAVSSNTGIPTGNVTFEEGSVLLGTTNLDTQGRVTYVTNALSAGAHTIIAKYQGDANYNPSSSLSFVQQVNKALPSLTLAGPSAPVNVTTLAVFGAKLFSSGVAPTGTLTLYDGTLVIATQQISKAGDFTLSTNALSVGQHSITVSYSGDANTEPAVSTGLNVTIQLAPSVIRLASSANPAVLATPITLTANVTSVTGNLTGSVQFSDGNQVLGSAALNNGSATFTTSNLAFGLHRLSALYLGDVNHASAASSTLEQSIIYKAVLGMSASPNPAYTGQEVSLTTRVAIIGGRVPSGLVTFQDGGLILGKAVLDGSGTASLSLSTLDVGTHAITASYSGDKDYSASDASTSLRIQNSLTQTAIQISANPATYASNLTLSALVTSTGGAATGRLQFVQAGTVIGSVVLDGNGNAAFQTSTLTPGPHSVVAQYLGDGRASASTSTPITFFVKQRTSLVLTADNNPALSLDGIVLHATLQFDRSFKASGLVAFAEGGKLLGTAPLDANGVATFTSPALGVGTHMITASYSGDDSDLASDSLPLAQLVKIRSTVTKLSAFASNSNDPQQVTYIAIVQSPTLSAVAGPTGSVTFYRGTSQVSTTRLDGNGVATVTLEVQANTSATLTAAYSGDPNYATSTSNPSTATPGPPTQFVLSVSNTDLKMQRGQRQSVTVMVASVKGFNDDMRFGCVGLPYAATCTFDKTSLQLAADGSASMQLIVDTGNPLGAGSVARNTKPLQINGAKLVLCCLPFGSILLCGLRKKRVLKLLLVFVAAGVSVAAIGCGGLQMNSTPAGSYAFKVTAIGQQTGAQQAVVVSLVVNQ